MLIQQTPKHRLQLLRKPCLTPQKALFYEFPALQYETLAQILVKSRYTPLGAQKIKISADRERGPPLPLHHKISY